ncbi:MAG: type IV pilus biogenesis protein PilM [Betaproteobacteria bacterium]|nr:type IV pilus biogenesis protein PilM [Betaproteobacteria bacterium]
MAAYAFIIFVIAITAIVAHVDHQAVPSSGDSMQTTEAEWVVTYGGAAQQFLASNPGYSGAVTDAQLAPGLASWASLPGAMTTAGIAHGALVSSNRAYAWGVLPLSMSSGAVGRLIKNDPELADDAALSIDVNGALVNPETGGTTPAPAGIPNNAFVYAPQ